MFMNFNKVIYSNKLFFWMYYLLESLYRYLRYYRISDKDYNIKLFTHAHGKRPNLENPKTLNEKIIWLKLNVRNTYYTQCVDKYLVREIIKKKFGEEYLIPLVFHTEDYKEITPDRMPDYPVIVKANHNSGTYMIIRDKNKINWPHLRTDCHWWLLHNYYYPSREWQYKNVKPQIVVEKLLEDKNGKIPNDYKLNCFNGKVEFIYVSVDREGTNKRNIYTRNWVPLHFTWANEYKDIEHLRGEEISPPSTLQKMIEMAEIIALDFPWYVRVDFYDVDGKIYFGEITLHHGGGLDNITPYDYDIKLGEKLRLPTD